MDSGLKRLLLSLKGWEQLQRRDDEINEILRNIDRKEDQEDELSEDSLLDRLPIGGKETPPQKAEQEIDEEYDEEDEEEGTKGRTIWNAVKRIYFGFESVFVVVIALAACGFLSHFLLTGAFDFLGLDQDDLPKEVILEEGMTIRQVSKLLEENEVISSPVIFRLYAKLKDIKDDELEAGKHVVNDNMSFDHIYDVLCSPIGSAGAGEVEITFREGLTLNEIADLLDKNEVCDKEKFINALQTEDFKFYFETLIPDSPNRFYKLEGYLFPDTYNFYVGENPKSAANRFLVRFYEMITSDLNDRMEEMNMTLDETVTLASIIQAEASGGGYQEMTRVSSVFHNRINNPEAVGGLLQSDVTIFYVNKNIKPYLSYTNQEMYDAYNTYKCVGLPVGAICNPGLDAIRAALYPEESNYYYFVTDKEGNFYYASTLDEHNANIATADRVNAELEKAEAASSAASSSSSESTPAA
jgi:UPF0755 protein